MISMQILYRKITVEDAIERLKSTEVIRTFYDIQKARISIGNRIKNREFVFCETCGIMYPKPKRRGKQVKKCANCGSKTIKIIKLESNPVLEDAHEHLLKLEKSLIAVMYESIKDDPLWYNYLAYVKGIGPVLASFLIKYLNPARFKSVSAMWKYCGLHVEYYCPKCKKVLVHGEYYNEGNVYFCKYCGSVLEIRVPKKKKGKKVDFNPFARGMCWRLADTLSKTGGYYKVLFQMLKARIREKRPNITNKHLRNDALRRLAKLFIAHFYEYGCMVLGIPPRRPYPILKGYDSYIPPVLDKKTSKELRTDERMRALLARHNIPMSQYLKYVDYFMKGEVKVTE